MIRLAKAIRGRREKARNQHLLIDAIEGASSRSLRDELVEIAWTEGNGRPLR